MMSCIICGEEAQEGTRYCGGDRGCPERKVMCDLHFDIANCNHEDDNVCADCAGLSSEEVAALRDYAKLLMKWSVEPEFIRWKV